MTRGTVVTITGLLVVCLAAVVVRTHNLEGLGLEYDETETIREIVECTPRTATDYLTLRNLWDPANATPFEIANEIQRAFPGYYFLARALVPDLERPGNVERLRMFSVVCGILTVPAAWLLGLRFGRPTAWLTAAFALLHPQFHFHAHYIRFYAPLILAAVAGQAWAVWVFPALPDWLRSERGGRRLAGYLAAGASGLVLAAPLTLHLGGAFVSAALGLTALHYLGRSRAAAVVLGVTLLASVVPVANSLHHFYMRAVKDPYQAQNVMSASPAAGLASMLFNVGLAYCLVAGAFLLRPLRRPKGGEAPDPHEAPLRLGLVVSAGAVVAILAVKHQLFRHDYAIGIFSLILLAAAVEIQRFWRWAGGEAGAAVTALVLLPMLPSLLSNVFVDGDRVAYLEAIEWLRRDAAGARAAVFVDSAGTLKVLDPREGDGLDYLPTANWRDFDLTPYSRLYWLMREIKGFRTHRFAGFDHIPGRLVAVIGKDRFDLRICRLYVFRQDQTPAAGKPVTAGPAESPTPPSEGRR